MENYKLSQNGQSVQRQSDKAFIPSDPANTDYAEYQAWLAEGNTPDAADAAPDPTWQEKRQANVADGGYGEVTEQLEIIGEQGMDVYQAHIAAVKAAIPKS